MDFVILNVRSTKKYNCLLYGEEITLKVDNDLYLKEGKEIRYDGGLGGGVLGRAGWARIIKIIKEEGKKVKVKIKKIF